MRDEEVSKRNGEVCMADEKDDLCVPRHKYFGKLDDSSMFREQAKTKNPIEVSEYSDSELILSYISDPFGFAVKRKFDWQVLFNSSSESKDPYESSLYGVGENSQPHGIKFYPNDPYTLFTTDVSAINLNTDLYGSHPVYMDLRNVGNEAYAHSVLLLNSNGIDVFYRGTSLTYKVIGGVFDFYFFAGPTPLGVVNQYTAFIGRPAPMPYWSLGLFCFLPSALPSLTYSVIPTSSFRLKALDVCKTRRESSPNSTSWENVRRRTNDHQEGVIKDGGNEVLFNDQIMKRRTTWSGSDSHTLPHAQTHQTQTHPPSINAAVELHKQGPFSPRPTHSTLFEALQLFCTNCSKIPALKHLRSLTHPSGIDAPKPLRHLEGLLVELIAIDDLKHFLHLSTQCQILRSTDQLTAAVDVGEGDAMLEIRLRTGSLINVLINAGAFVLAIKKDPHMATHVSERFAETDRFKNMNCQGSTLEKLPAPKPPTKWKLLPKQKVYHCCRSRTVPYVSFFFLLPPL
ncbi:hypothetical protein ACFX1X_028605 [Malus domestica]|uniref:Uncharacterized protein n=1 Tax=Malus domestica TaxID=3750 RepID=A0A498KCR8_MALDO|nr:hypothetical protein DVH24_006404 [Malus domestica]